MWQHPVARSTSYASTALDLLFWHLPGDKMEFSLVASKNAREGICGKRGHLRKWQHCTLLVRLLCMATKFEWAAHGNVRMCFSTKQLKCFRTPLSWHERLGICLTPFNKNNAPHHLVLFMHVVAVVMVHQIRPSLNCDHCFTSCLVHLL